MENKELLIDINELANRLKVHKNTLYKLTAKGEIPCFKIGLKNLYYFPDVFEKLRNDSKKKKV